MSSGKYVFEVSMFNVKATSLMGHWVEESCIMNLFEPICLRRKIFCCRHKHFALAVFIRWKTQSVHFRRWNPVLKHKHRLPCLALHFKWLCRLTLSSAHYIDVTKTSCRLMSCIDLSWWRHQMEAFSANYWAFGRLYGEFTGDRWIPRTRPVMWSFDYFFNLHPNKRLCKQWWGLWFETPSCPLWRHFNGTWEPSFLPRECSMGFIDLQEPAPYQ